MKLRRFFAKEHFITNHLSINEVTAKEILTRSNLPGTDYSANPYTGCEHACRYCYASFMKRFSNHPEPWGRFVDVKNWPKIKNAAKYAGKRVFISSVTDPYQPAEGKYGRTRSLLEQLQGSGIRISIATKSDLILRDLHLIKTFPRARVSWSLNTLDESFRLDMDRAVSVERRLTAMKAFYEAGIHTICFISPIFPEITNVQALIERVQGQCNLIWLENLNLRGSYRQTVLNYIRQRHPQLSPLYEAIYRKKHLDYWYALDRRIREFSVKKGFEYVKDDDARCEDFGKPPAIVNYFFHGEITPSAKRETRRLENERDENLRR